MNNISIKESIKYHLEINEETNKIKEMTSDEEIIEYAKRLSRRYKLIVLKRKDGLTYREIGEEFNITYERVKQIYQKSLRILRHPDNSWIVFKSDIINKMINK